MSGADALAAALGGGSCDMDGMDDKVQGTFLVFDHLSRRTTYWIWCGFALIAYLENSKSFA